jgi:Ca2+/Na+ antiporter
LLGDSRLGRQSSVVGSLSVAQDTSGGRLADRARVNSVIFGATVLATATALHEISSGIAAVRLGARSLRCRVRLGPDSILALAVFGLGLAGLFVLP